MALEHSGKPSRFEIQPTIEQKPFESAATRSFFSKWCEINDSIVPEFITREEWEQKRIQGIFEKRSDGKYALFIPPDLQLWEMVGVMETVDHDTFAAKPERQGKKKEELLALGNMFQHAGAYMAQRLDAIEEGKEIARALALELHDYGRALTSGEKPEDSGEIEAIARSVLSPEETEAVDRFLAGTALYASRHARAEEAVRHGSKKGAPTDPARRDAAYEQERRQTLRQFFKTSERAFELRGKTERGELRSGTNDLKPWQSDTPIHDAFLARVEKAFAREAETPKRELEAAISRRGLAKLAEEIKGPDWKRARSSFFGSLGVDLDAAQKRLADIIDIKRLKTELEDVRRSGDVDKISAKETEIADAIFPKVARYQYVLNAHNPSEMVATAELNCVGASTLGGALLEEAGVRYLVGEVPEHSVLFLVTSNGNVEWRDATPGMNPFKPRRELITDYMADGASSATIKDIVALSRNPTSHGVSLKIFSEKWREAGPPPPWVAGYGSRYCKVYAPEYGHRLQLLHNAGCALYNIGGAEGFRQAAEAFKQVVDIDPENFLAYQYLGKSYYELGRKEEAAGIFRRIIRIDPKDYESYYLLGRALSDLGRKKEALETLRACLELARDQRNDRVADDAKREISKLEKGRTS